MAKKAAAKKEDLPYILPQLRQFAVPISTLNLDPKNSLKHGEHDLPKIADMLREFTQRIPIVVDEATRTVLKGNGTMMAAQRLGWTHIAAVPVSDDRAKQIRYAIGDNQSGRIAEWDAGNLAELAAELDALGPVSDSPHLDAMLEELTSWAENQLAPAEPTPESAPAEAAAEPTPAAPKSKYQVLITCKDEQHQIEVLELLAKKKLKARALIA